MGKTLVLGGTGLLGSEMKRINPELICLGSSDCDITNFNQVNLFIARYDPETIILCAACLDNGLKTQLIHVNILGTANVSNICSFLGTRLVYI